MASTLTKPQARFLLDAMERPRVCYGPTYRVVGTLKVRGMVEEAGRDPLCHAELYRPTRYGLEALTDYWERKDAASGCIAYRERAEQVRAALAALAA